MLNFLEEVLVISPQKIMKFCSSSNSEHSDDGLLTTEQIFSFFKQPGFLLLPILQWRVCSLGTMVAFFQYTSFSSFGTTD
jgi:hypothetical protein